MFITYKRWRLRADVSVQAAVDLAQGEIVPYYQQLDSDVRLGLEQIEGENAVLATQRWIDRHHRDRTMTGPAYDIWWTSYVPILERWDRLVILEAEWEACQLL